MKRIIHFLTLAILLSVSSCTSAQDNSNKEILVSGATGTQGGAVARALLEKGFTVRAMTRNPDSDRAKALANLGMTVVQGDFDDAASIDAALEGAYGAYSVQQWRSAGFEGEVTQGKSFADAAKRAGVEHFVYASVGTWEPSRIPYFNTKLEIEAHVRELGFPNYTILKPTTFMSNFAGRNREDVAAGLMRGPFPPDMLNPYISPNDIGRFTSEAFDNPEEWNGKTLEIASDSLSYAEVAEVFSELVGHEVRYEQIPWEDFVKANEDIATDYVVWNHRVGYQVNVDELREEFPWLQSLTDYLSETW